MSDEAKIKKAEIKYIFTNTNEPKAILKLQYMDGSTKNSEGIQAIEEADKTLEELKENPIFQKEEQQQEQQEKE